MFLPNPASLVAMSSRPNDLEVTPARDEKNFFHINIIAVTSIIRIMSHLTDYQPVERGKIHQVSEEKWHLERYSFFIFAIISQLIRPFMASNMYMTLFYSRKHTYTHFLSCSKSLLYALCEAAYEEYKLLLKPKTTSSGLFSALKRETLHLNTCLKLCSQRKKECQYYMSVTA